MNFYGLENLMPALKQGLRFHEGFGNLAGQTNKLLNETQTVKTDPTLQDEYQSTLAQYQKLYNEITNASTEYVNRTSPSNPFLNKNIRFTTGEICYVTNQGVAKLIPNEEIWNSLRNSPGKTYIDLTIPWKKAYSVPGTVIPTSPSLLSGTSMILGQSCGNEGLNVYVDKLVSNSSTKYDGCYSSNAMTYIGGDPNASLNMIQNGDFAQGQIAKDSYKTLNNDATTVPGWNFSCSLLNNSKAWGYPMPYPNGNQCASLQKTQELSTTKRLDFAPGVTYTLTLDAVGRNCCDKSSVANAIDVSLEGGKKIFSFTPAIGKWNSYTTTFKVDSQQSKRVFFKGTWSSSDRASAIKNIVIRNGSQSSGGTYNFEMCKQAAVDGGYKYFGLENMNMETGMGFCGVSNDGVGIFKEGKAMVVTGGNIIWSSKTKDGVSFSLTNQGTLTVYNAASAAIFNTNNSKAKPEDYMGCYADKSSRAIPLQAGGKKYDYNSCKQLAQKNNAKYFSLQDSSTGANASCGITNDLGSARKYGVATNCSKIVNGSSTLYTAGSWTNALYSVDGTSAYYLILQDDGNMCIYRGSGPTDNQGLIWSSNTAGKQSKPNPNYSAAKSKYGQNWIKSGTSLSAGDFVGSNDGSIYLMMQPDGNLTLNISQDAENCQMMKDGYRGGGVKASAIYEMTEVGFPENLGKLAYVDADTSMHTYPDDNVGLSMTYKTYKNFDSKAKNIRTEGQSSVEKCKTSCNKTKECYGFVFNTETNACYLKDKSLQKEARQTMRSSNLYMRDVALKNLPAGITDKVVNIDSIAYGDYPTSGEEIGKDKWTMKNTNTVQKQQLEQLQAKLDLLSGKLVSETTDLSKKQTELADQTNINKDGIGDYMNHYREMNKKVNNYNQMNMENIVHDSELNVLRDNYKYLFWSILAAGTVLVTMKISEH